MNLVERLRQDYYQFPSNQTYDLYAEDVYFKDPLNQFRGIERYRRMIGFIERWFINVRMDLQDIKQQGDLITTRWTLSWQAPVPWKPQMTISGRSELFLNPAGLICRHIDYWDCSRLAVLKQLFQPVPRPTG